MLQNWLENPTLVIISITLVQDLDLKTCTYCWTIIMLELYFTFYEILLSFHIIAYRSARLQFVGD